MKIIVCPLSQVRRMVEAHAPERVVSLLDPDFEFPELGSAYLSRHLRLHFHDIHESADGQILPGRDHVEQLLSFLQGWECARPLLIHCRAGISRSTAAAFVAACVHSPRLDERTIALGLRRASPLARPNHVLVRLADLALGRNGRMSRAIEETGRGLEWHGADENVPFEIGIIPR